LAILRLEAFLDLIPSLSNFFPIFAP